MKAHRSGRFFAFMALAALFLAACQPAALENSGPAVDPAAQPLEAGAEEPVAHPPKAWQLRRRLLQLSLAPHPAEKAPVCHRPEGRSRRAGRK
jgi:hypothetical protein